jgi:hypothetical protein
MLATKEIQWLSSAVRTKAKAVRVRRTNQTGASGTEDQDRRTRVASVRVTRAAVKATAIARRAAKKAVNRVSGAASRVSRATGKIRIKEVVRTASHVGGGPLPCGPPVTSNVSG